MPMTEFHFIAGKQVGSQNVVESQVQGEIYKYSLAAWWDRMVEDGIFYFILCFNRYTVETTAVFHSGNILDWEDEKKKM